MAPIVKAVLVSAALPLVRPVSGCGLFNQGCPSSAALPDGGCLEGTWDTHAGACRLTAEGDDGADGTDFVRLTDQPMAKDKDDCQSQCASWKTKHGVDCKAYETGNTENGDFQYCEIWFVMPAMGEVVTADMHKCVMMMDGEWTTEEGACRKAEGDAGVEGTEFVKLDKQPADKVLVHTVVDIADCQHKCANWATLNEDGNACHAIEVHKKAGKLGDYCEIWVSEPMGASESTDHDCYHYQHAEDSTEAKGATPAPEIDASSTPVSAALAGSAALAMMAAIVV